MAKWLSEITKDPYDAQHLPKFDFKFVKNETAIRFRVTSTEEIEVVDDKLDVSAKKDSTNIKSSKKEKPKMEKKASFCQPQPFSLNNNINNLFPESEWQQAGGWRAGVLTHTDIGCEGPLSCCVLLTFFASTVYSVRVSFLGHCLRQDEIFKRAPGRCVEDLAPPRTLPSGRSPQALADP